MLNYPKTKFSMAGYKKNSPWPGLTRPPSPSASADGKDSFRSLSLASWVAGSSPAMVRG